MERHRACTGTRCGRKGGSTGTARSARCPARGGTRRREALARAARRFGGKERFSPPFGGKAVPLRATAGRFARSAFLLVAALALGIALLAASPHEANAAAVPSIGAKAHGSCYIENSWRTNGQTYFNAGGFSGDLSGAWAVSDLECLDHTAAAPTYTNATYEATVTAVSVQGGWVEYSVRITPPGVTDGVTKNEHGLVGYQRVGGAMRVARSFTGGIELVKASAIEKLSGANPCYSLAGAAYGVYRDEACSDRWFTMTTDGSGRWKTALDIPVGTYWVKELSPPPGYALDETRYRVAVQADRHALVNGGAVADMPQTAMAEALVCKHDGEMAYRAGDAKAQGGASLAHAQYAVSFYAGYRSVSDLSWIDSAQPLRTWVMQTDERGIVSLSEGDGAFTDADGKEHRYKVSGPDFYRNADGRIVLPLGTVTVQETAAPEGHLLPAGGRTYARQVTGGGTSDTVRTYLAPIDPEQVARGDVALTKIASASPVEGDGGIKDVLVGVDFQIINANDGPVVRADGTLAARGETVATVTTDDRGYASTAGGALPYGSYIVHEVAGTVPAGYAVVEDFTVTIADDGQELYYVLEDGTGTPLRVVKTDAETGRQIAGHMSFRILDERMQVVTFTRHYPTVSHLSAFTTDSRGACMLPEKLNGGRTYYLQEIAAPDGYVLGEDPVPFTVDGTAGCTWANPLTVELPNHAQKGTIAVSKTDAETGGAVPACTYEVRAAEDIVTNDGTVRAVAGDLVARIETGEDGVARTGELYLGSYEVAEARQADGFLLDAERHAATLSYAGQAVSVTTAALDVTDAPVRVEVRKTRSGSGAPVEGATFAWWNAADERENDAAAPDGAEAPTRPIDRVDEDRIRYGTTGADGVLAVSYLAPGTYGFMETEAPAGYVADGAVQYVTVDEDGRIDGEPIGILPFENDCTETLVRKADATTGEAVAGAALELYALARDGDQERRELVEMWTSGTEPHLIEALPPGDYALHEEIAPAGYLAAEDLVFTVEPTGAVQEVEMRDDRTKTDIVKVDAASGEPLPGAVLALVDAAGTCIDPREHLASPSEIEVREIELDGTDGATCGWVSTSEPVRFEKLPVGELTLVEVEAPDGYRKAEPVRFDVEASAEVQTVSMVDEAEGAAFGKTGVDLPASAGAGALAALLAAGSGVAIWRRFGTAR